MPQVWQGIQNAVCPQCTGAPTGGAIRAQDPCNRTLYTRVSACWLEQKAHVLLSASEAAGGGRAAPAVAAASQARAPARPTHHTSARRLAPEVFTRMDSCTPAAQRGPLAVTRVCCGLLNVRPDSPGSPLKAPQAGTQASLAICFIACFCSMHVGRSKTLLDTNSIKQPEFLRQSAPTSALPSKSEARYKQRHAACCKQPCESSGCAWQGTK